MKTSLWLFLALSAAAGAGLAQNAPLSGISETTDPVKIAEIEKRAQEIAAKPQVEQSVAPPAPQARAKRHRGRKAKPAKRAPAASGASS